MSVPFSELVSPLSSAQWKASLLDALQGRGFVRQTGLGSGRIAISGTPAATYDVEITIQATGELGTGTYQYTLVDDAGLLTQSDLLTIPAGGTVALGSTGITLTFTSGSDGESFVYQDVYAFSLITPTFPTDSWQEGSVPRTLLQIFCDALEDSDATGAAVAAAGLLGFVTQIGKAADSWLDLLGAQFYLLTRKPAIATQGVIHLADPNSAGPYTIAVGDLWVADVNGKRFTNITGGVLPQGSTLDLVFQAELPGSGGNVGNETIKRLLTTLAGVTVNNPVYAAGSWVTLNGVDKESNAAYALRCQQRWPSLGIGGPDDKYALWATTASNAVTRSKIFVDSINPGQVDIYLAGAAGPVAGGEVTAVQNYINSRLPLTSIAVVASAAGHVVAVGGTVYVKAAKLATAQAKGLANLQAYLLGLPIGGDVAAGPGGIVSREKIIGCLTDVDGVVDALNITPAADVALTATEVATYTVGLVWTAV